MMIPAAESVVMSTVRTTHEAGSLRHMETAGIAGIGQVTALKRGRIAGIRRAGRMLVI